MLCNDFRENMINTYVNFLEDILLNYSPMTLHLINQLLKEIWDEIWLVVLSFWSFRSNQCFWLACRISKGFCYAKLKIEIKLIKISKFHQKQTESSSMDKKKRKQLGKRNTNVWEFSNTRKCKEKIFRL